MSNDFGPMPEEQDDAIFMQKVNEQSGVKTLSSWQIQIRLSDLFRRVDDVGVLGLTSEDWGCIEQVPELKRRLSLLLANRRRLCAEKAVGADALAEAGYGGAVVEHAAGGTDFDKTALHISMPVRSVETKPPPEPPLFDADSTMLMPKT